MRTGFLHPRFFLVTSFAILGLGIANSACAKDEFRTWGDAKGKNKITAKFVKVEDNLVTLEKEDGDEVEIELQKLSTLDQKYVADAVKNAGDSPFKKKSSDSSKPKSKTGKSNAADSMDADEQSGEGRVIKVKYTATKQVKLTSPGKSWKVELSSESPRKSVDTDALISLSPRIDFFEKMNGFAVGNCQDGRKAVVSYCLEKRGDGATTRLILTDLSKGESTDPVSSPGQFSAIALHDDGVQVLMRRDAFGFGNHDRLEVWKLNDEKISKLLAWLPYEYERVGPGRDVTWAEFIDDERLLTCNSSGRVIVWKYPEIRPTSAFDTSHGCIPALSSDRKLLAYSTGTAVGVMDITRQKVLAQQDVKSKLESPKMAFSPTAKKLACVAQDVISVWDVASGKLEHTIPGEGTALMGQIEFVDDGFVLVGKSCLIDLENELKLWTYQGAEHVQAVDGAAIFVFNNWQEKPGAIVPTELPHAAAKDLMQKALTQPEDFALHEGTAVRIDVNSITDVTFRERVATALKKQLEAIGCKGGSSGTIDLIASVEGPKEINVSYHGTGDYKFKEYRTRVKFVYQNQTAWESVGANTPGVISLKAGENIESHLRSVEKPNYEYFERIRFPKFLQKPVKGQGPGSSLTIGLSKITEKGIE